MPFTDRLGEIFLSQHEIVRKAAWIAASVTTAISIPAIALSNSIGEGGINASRLHAPPYNLLGRKIAIGQVEIGRPAQFGIDKEIEPNHGTAVSGVFFRDRPAKIDTHVDGHAQNVAGVMVGNAKVTRGVAPEARLYASAAASTFGMNRQVQECLATQHVAEQNSGDVRAINFSFGEPLWLDPRPDAVLDGNALLTRCIDWSAQAHNVLYVIAGNQGDGGIPIPTDNYNGINVAFTRQVDGTFNQVDVANLGSVFTGVESRLVGLESNLDGRRSVSLVAPGRNVELLNLDGSVSRDSGSSFAAPHAAGTVALLQEYGDRQLQRQASRWSLDSRRHEVMKAVLLNAADKIQDRGNGLRQGMSRTVLDKDSKTWLDSDAYRDRQVPLHGDMGTGHLNAFRAYEQFRGGQWSPQAPVAPIGWDYRSVETSDHRDYIIDSPLPAGSFVAATLAWNREVELNDANDNNLYDAGETFRDGGLNDLNLYLMPADADNTDESVWSSVSEVDSVEHIFHRIPETGRYKLRVEYRHQANEPTQPFALAWWAVSQN